MRVLFAILALFVTVTNTSAQQMHAVAVSPDGSVILAAGDNRTLYTIDPATMEITNRRYIPELVREIVYSPDGRRIYLRMDKDMVRVVSAGSWKQLFEIDDVYAMSLSSDGARLAVLDDHYKGGILQLVNAKSGKLMSRMEFPDMKTKMLALSADGTRAMLLTQGEKSDTEAKENPPSDLKGYDKHLFRQQKDGYVSKVLTINFVDESHQIRDSFYRSSFPFQVRMMGDKMAVLNGASDSALIAADGSVELVNFGEAYLNNARLSNDGSKLLITNGTKFMVHPMQDGGVAGAVTAEVEGPRINGPGEWVTAMDEAADGTIYLVTNAYRLWKISPGAAQPEISNIF